MTCCRVQNEMRGDGPAGICQPACSAGDLVNLNNVVDIERSTLKSLPGCICIEALSIGCQKVNRPDSGKIQHVDLPLVLDRE